MAAKKHMKNISLDHFEPLHIESMEDILYQPPTVIGAPPNLGNASTRTQQQSLLALKDANDYLLKSMNDTVCFTDGSALKNPGPCGGAAIIFWSGVKNNATEHRVAVSKVSNSVHGELAVMELNLSILSNSTPAKPRIIHMLVDCQSAIDIVASTRIT